MNATAIQLPYVATTRRQAFDRIRDSSTGIFQPLKKAALPLAWKAVVKRGEKRCNRTDYGTLKAMRRISTVARLASPRYFCGGMECDDLLRDLLAQSILLMEQADPWLRDRQNRKLLWRERRELRKITPERLRAKQQVLAELRHPTGESEA